MDVPSIPREASASEDSPAFTGAGDITGSYDAPSGVLTLSGTGTVADYQAVLRSVTYDNSTGTGPEDRTVTFAVDDGGDTSNTVERTVAITAPAATSIVNPSFEDGDYTGW